MLALKAANLALRFLLELCLLAAFAYWGFQSGGQTMAKIALGIGVPLLAAVIWGFFMAPKSSRRLRDPWRLLAELALFGLAAAALASIGRDVLALALLGLYAVNRFWMVLWRQT
jgi:hypothetical protein